MSAPVVAFVGFGELAGALAAGMRDNGAGEIRAHVRRPAGAARAEAVARRLAQAGVRACDGLPEALRGADAVIAAVPSAAAQEVAAACAACIDPGTLYVDPAPLRPALKLGSEAVLAAAGARYVDAAVLGTVVVEGHRVPTLAAGPGARRWAELAGALGLAVTVVEGPAGRATAVKLLRSVYTKGRDALVLEMLLAARRHGLEAEVLASVGGPAEQVPFPELARRVLGSLALHAGRRADELEACAAELTAAGVEPLATRGGARRLRWMAQAGLRERLGGRRPAGVEEVLDALDALRQPAEPDVPGRGGRADG